jgi:hypothetical protein
MRLLHLTSGPHVTVECARLLLHLERGCHGITASLLDATGELTKELHYVAGDCTLGDGRHLRACSSQHKVCQTINVLNANDVIRLKIMPIFSAMS